jgi:hypothetical protein
VCDANTTRTVYPAHPAHVLLSALVRVPGRTEPVCVCVCVLLPPQGQDVIQLHDTSHRALHTNHDTESHIEDSNSQSDSDADASHDPTHVAAEGTGDHSSTGQLQRRRRLGRRLGWLLPWRRPATAGKHDVCAASMAQWDKVGIPCRTMHGITTRTTRACNAV